MVKDQNAGTSGPRYREAYRTQNGAYFPSSTIGGEDWFEGLKSSVDKKNRDSSIPAIFWIEKYDEATEQWKPVYPAKLPTKKVRR